MKTRLPFIVIRFLLTMYTSLKTHVEWDGVHSRWLCVKNGVKQGGVLSPVLFCVYIDGLLNALESARVRCCIGHHFI